MANSNPIELRVWRCLKIRANLINMNGKGKSILRTILLIVEVFVILCLSGATLYFLEYTVVKPLNVILPSLFAGFVLTYLFHLLRNRLSEDFDFWIDFIVQGLLVSSFLSAAFLGANFSLGNRDSHQEEVTVERLYYKTHHRSRRVGRRYVGQGAPYKVYYMEIGFANGKRKEVRLGQTGFRKHKKGQKLNLDMSKGLFGLPIITSGV